MYVGRDAPSFLLTELNSFMISCIRCWSCSRPSLRYCCLVEFDIEIVKSGYVGSVDRSIEVTLIVLCGVEFEAPLPVLFALLVLLFFP